MSLVPRVLAVIFFFMISGPPALAQLRMSEDGTGEVLLFPFYTAANNNETSFSLTNTASHAKALYLRFREGMSGADVIGFNLYLAPGDAFSATILRDPNGQGAALVTQDSSCTVPQLGDSAATPPGFSTSNADGSETRVQPFFNWDYVSDSNQSLERTLVGMLEVFEVGQWQKSSAGFNPVVPEIEKSAAGDRSGCNWLTQQWSVSAGVNGMFLDDSAAFAMPWAGGGLIGQMQISTHQGAAVFEIDPIAIEGFALAELPGEYHSTLTAVTDDYPAANLKNGSSSVLLPFARFGWNQPYDAGSGLNAVTLLLMATEMTMYPDIAGANEVAIVTFPTKNFHSYSSGERPPFSPLPPLDPFESLWNEGSSSACETIGIRGSAAGTGLYPYSDINTLEACSAINILYSEDDPQLSGAAEWLANRLELLDNNPAVLSFSSKDFSSPDAERRIRLGAYGSSVYGMPVVVVPLSFSGGYWTDTPASRRAAITDGSAEDSLENDADSDADGGNGDAGTGDAGSGGSSGFGMSSGDGGGSGTDSSAGSSSDTSQGGTDESTGSVSGGSSTGGTAIAGSFTSQLNLESPKEGEIYTGIGAIQGWAIDSSGALGSAISFYIDGDFRGQIAHGDSRGDVGSAFPNVANSGASGFSAALNFGELRSGWHVLELRATDSRGGSLESSVAFLVDRFGNKTYLSGADAPRATPSTSCDMIGNKIECTGVSVGGRAYSFGLDWNTATQNFEITRIQD